MNNDKKTNNSSLTPSAKIQQQNSKDESITNNETVHTSRYLKIIFLSMSMNILLGYLAFYYYPQTQYIATANASAVCKVPSLDKPHIHHAVVTDFAVEAALGIYDYNYGNYKRSIANVTEQYFTPNFRDIFMKAFGNSENLQRVISEYLTVIPGRDGMAAQIERNNIKDNQCSGPCTWVIDVPIVVHYVSGRKDHAEKVLAIVQVVQVDPQVNVRGLAVSSIELKQML